MLRLTPGTGQEATGNDGILEGVHRTARDMIANGREDEIAYSLESYRPIPVKVTSQSRSKLPVNPVQKYHPIHGKVTACRPPVRAVSRIRRRIASHNRFTSVG